MRRNPFLFEINTVAWLHELSVRYGRSFTIGSVPAAEWDRLKNLGFDSVWLMGVWKRSDAGKRLFMEDSEFRAYRDALPDYRDEDLIGSPYSIAAYEPDALVGTWEDLAGARREINLRGMGLILDFVPNHTAHDHPWVTEHPEFYLHGTEEDAAKDPRSFSRFDGAGGPRFIAKGRDPFFPPWHDTLQLNYFSEKTQNAMIGELNRIAACCDGVRCDMAMLVLGDIFSRTWGWANRERERSETRYEFWTKVRYAFPKLVLIAEAYWDTEWLLQQLGFDFVYDKRFYDRLILSSPGELYMHLEADVTFQEKLVRFLENHDEARSAVRFSTDRLMAVATLFATVPGMKLIHQGQIEGRRLRLPVQFRRTAPETADAGVKAVLERVLAIANQDAFHAGKWRLKEVRPFEDETYRNFVAYIVRTETALKLVAVNLGWATSRGRIVLQGEVEPGKQYVLCDELNDTEYVREGSEMVGDGLKIVIEGHRAHVFDFRAKE